MRLLASLLCLCLCLSLPLAAQTRHEYWKWVDADGVTHFSDKPVPGATRVDIVGAPSRPAGSTATTPAAAPPAATRPAERVQYELLEIWQPENGETFFNSDANVPVGLRLTPSLARGDSIALYLDGKRVEDFPETGLDYMLMGAERGAHTLTAAVADADGSILIRSNARVFHLRQASTANPPVGPTQTPKPPRPPKPQPKPSAR